MVEFAYKLAGAVGVEPGNYTLRQLYWMWIAKGKAEWARTDMLCCVVANILGGKSKPGSFVPECFKDKGD